MNTKATHAGFLVLLVLVATAGALIYPHLPEQVASHWNINGEADGYANKLWELSLFVIILAGLYLLYAVIPKIDPLKANIQSFRKYYNLFFLGMGAFFAYLFALSIVWNLGYHFDFGAAMSLAFAALLWLMSILLKHAKRNWFVGIRTPWTLSSDKVWGKTHALGARLFKVAAVVTLGGALFGGFVGFVLLFGSLLASTIITVVYSYVTYRKR